MSRGVAFFVNHTTIELYMAKFLRNTKIPTEWQANKTSPIITSGKMFGCRSKVNLFKGKVTNFIVISVSNGAEHEKG
jgi:hypothetical protein